MANIVLAPKWEYTRTISFNTSAQETASRQGNVFVRLATFPTWRYKWEVPLLQGRMDDPTSAVSSVAGLFANAGGRAGTFLFNDPRDNTVVTAQFGTGDGSSKVFQLIRPVGPFSDIVQNLNGTPHIYINAVETFLFSIDGTGVVTFNTAPANNAVLTWSGNFYFMLRFKADDLEFKNFFEGAWTVDMELESVIR